MKREERPQHSWSWLSLRPEARTCAGKVELTSAHWPQGRASTTEYRRKEPAPLAVTSGGAENTEPSLLAVTWREPLTLWAGTWHTAAAREASDKRGGTQYASRCGTVCTAQSCDTAPQSAAACAWEVRTNGAGVHIRGGHDDGARCVCKAHRQPTGACKPRARERQRHAALTHAHRGCQTGQHRRGYWVRAPKRGWESDSGGRGRCLLLAVRVSRACGLDARLDVV
jgi:hypothetical protein